MKILAGNFIYNYWILCKKLCTRPEKTKTCFFENLNFSYFSLSKGSESEFPKSCNEVFSTEQTNNWRYLWAKAFPK